VSASVERTGVGEEAALSRVRSRRRQRILDSALRTFLRDGYHGTTMEQVAEEADVSKQTLYNYFVDKNELLFSVFEARYSVPPDPAFAAALAGLASPDAEQALREATRLMFRKTFDPEFIALQRLKLELAKQRPDLMPKLQERIAERHPIARWRAAIERGIEAGYLRPVDADVVAVLLSATGSACGLYQTFGFFHPHKSPPPERMAAVLADLIGRGLLRDADPPPGPPPE
jgi:TetR/AcrR family transcriptional regulator, mexJK operon transcriptional repressor